MVNRLDPNYYHWIVESCGQLAGIEEYQARTGRCPELLVRRGGAAFIRQSLAALGMKAERIVEWEPTRVAARARRLLVSTVPGNGVCQGPSNLRWLRKRFLAGAGVRQELELAERLIYIPRSSKGWRAIRNNDEVSRSMEEMGFEVVSPERMSFTEQVRRFAGARVIVGMHGAGLTNVVFAPNATVLELVGDYGGGEYFSLAKSLKQPYRYLNCETIGDDIRVDLDALKRAVEHVSTGDRICRNDVGEPI